MSFRNSNIFTAKQLSRQNLSVFISRNEMKRAASSLGHFGFQNKWR